MGPLRSGVVVTHVSVDGSKIVDVQDALDENVTRALGRISR
jgi:hypothetical protein